MFYISKTSLLFFVLSLIFIAISLGIKAFNNINDTNIFIFILYGFFLNVLMGAMYQLIPNSLNKKPLFPTISYFIFGLNVINIFVLGLWFFGFLDKVYMAFYEAFVMIGFFIHISSALKKPNSITPKFLMASLFFMIANAFIIILWAFNKVNIYFLIHTFTIGFILNAIMGVELALVPLLYMEPINMAHANRLFWIHQLSAIVLMISFYFQNLKFVYGAGIFEFLVIGFFVYIIYKSVENRKFPKNIPYTLRYFFSGLGFLLIGISIGLLVASNYVPAFLHGDIMIYGFGVITVAGGVFHFMPRITWNDKYKDKIGSSEKPPPIDAMINQDMVKKVLPLSVYSVLIQIIFETNKYIHFLGDSIELLLILSILYALRRK